MLNKLKKGNVKEEGEKYVNLIILRTKKLILKLDTYLANAQVIKFFYVR